MNILSSHNPSLRALSLMLMVLLLTFATPPAEAQTAGKISIGGKVYGGGKMGAILTGNTAATKDTEPKDVTLTETDFTQVAAQASQVTINSADDADVQITAVFGGGEQGRAYGKTNVTINGGTVGVTDTDALAAMPDADKPVNGNAFGAGDGQGADVFGGTHVLITAGTINGSVYGGGNQADLVGSTELTLQGGKYVGAVFGGAKQADIFGRAYVNIDGLNAKSDLHIIDVYGGNDVAGSINPSENWGWTQTSALSANTPFALASTPHLSKLPGTVVNGTWNAFVLATDPANSSDDEVKTKKVLIDNIYGGGNGDYDYATSNIVDDKETNPYYGLNKPVIDRTYLQIEGGMYGSLYGGGNAATVAVSTDICLVNGTEASASYLASLAEPSLSRFSSEYAFNRVFGGNNKEPMAIRPNWYLEKASVNNLYSGGNAGAMTYAKPNVQNSAMDAGILIHVESAEMTVNNVYGGCRMADVNPGMLNGNMTISLNAETIDGYQFPLGYSARVLIQGGNINNVYGGNDVSGNVYYGSDVEVLSSINGNVYGAGNGSYAYTDNKNLQNDPVYGDYYYDGGTGGLASAQALSKHRPNAEKSYVHVAGSSTQTTYIGGAVYCGGNSATLRSQSGSLTDATSELHIGSYVIADNVFLGSNGENMVKSKEPYDLLQIYKNGPVGYDKATKGAYSSMDLTSSAQFEEYMCGVEVAIKPVVTFDQGYADHTTKFGSLYCGGNVGSMSADGYFNVDFLQKLVIYNKLVGGCNNANVAKTAYNAFHMGGLTGAPDANNNKVLLTVAGLQLEPRVLTGNVKSGFSLTTWNKNASGMLQGGNIYGGCYSSGYINGGVNIDIQQNAISPDVFTSSGVTYEEIRDDVLASTLACYGGGYGKETEIWGNVTVSITDNGQIMKAYGGGEMGVVGKLQRNATTGAYLTQNVDEWYHTTNQKEVCDTTVHYADYASKDHPVAQFADGGTYHATVNLNANLPAGTTNNVAKLYGGGFQGTISGNTTVNLNQGRVYDAFGGASNADILGHAETYVGHDSEPTVTNNVYGANDFGGLIVGNKTFLVDNNKDGDNEDTMEKIVAQTYVEYSSGNIAGNLFGGPCGAYEYTDDRFAAVTGADGFCKPQLLRDLLTTDMLTPLSGAGYAANSFVNVISQSALASDVIAGAIFGAGQGLKGRINSADERGSYVRLAAATTSQRTVGNLSPRVYGAGYCSNTNRSLVDAYTGYFGTIFGAAHGISYEELPDVLRPDGTYETNYMGYRSAVRLHQMENSQMDIYGGGANAGAQESGVVLNGGEAHNVYGASFDQGITYAASVDVPENSTVKVNAIFGGAKGKNDVYPCDVYNSFVTWHSANARVNDAIYGGNDAYRMTRNAYIVVNKPVMNKQGQLTNVFGGGFGENTVTLYTSVGLQEGAQVKNVYGGGNNGQVLDTPSFRYYLDDGKQALADGSTKTEKLKDYPGQLTGYGYEKYLQDTEVKGFHTWIMTNYWTDCRHDDRDQPLGAYQANNHGHPHDLYFLSTQMKDMKNTNVFIMQGATVAENAYGGGYGDKATVSGETMVHLWGGQVQGDIYGGGYGGHVEEYAHLIHPNRAHELTLSATNVDLQGGIARNVYGGGLNGRVTGSTNVVLGQKDVHRYDFYGTTLSGQYEHQVVAGDPIIERSLYGGGQMGPVYGTAYLTINQGHVGYKYDASQETTPGVSNAACYVENLDLNDPGDNFLDQNGNAFGAGYGEGASVDVTVVNIYGGTIRNSLYGGGEIAAVGRGTMRTDVGANKELNNISVAGRTNIFMYNGLVQGDVFGGGRGFSYDLTGNEVVGKTLYTDGYVFGTTNVNIRGGVVGTDESLQAGHGNVFGGGNIGYVFSDATKDGKKGESDGHGGTYTGRYYTNTWQCNHCHAQENSLISPHTCIHCQYSTDATDAAFQTSFTQVNGSPVLSEDTRVVVSPYAQATSAITIDGVQYAVGDYVPTEQLNKLGNKNTDVGQWAKLSDAGVIVRNAVFAGGNVSAGSDKVYANATTVFGNATASITDVFLRDLITLGTDNIGGLYGDGNLTFVDGYRELNITNYGTDYYSQDDNISLEKYNQLTDRERAYFELQYSVNGAYSIPHYVCNIAGVYGGVEYQKGQHILPATYSAFSDTEKASWTEGTADVAASHDKISESEYKLLTDDEKANWTAFGFCSIYAGRIMNTIQRADFCGIFGSRLVLQGAQDRVPEVVDYTPYTVNRVAEMSLNAKTIGDQTHGNYVGFYNVVNFLGALSSDVKFTDTRTTTHDTYIADGKSFYDWKEYYLTTKKRNNGDCHNVVALASGVYLELVEDLDNQGRKNYGLITGIVQLDLINVMTGLGGGYVYARNEHGAVSGNLGAHQNLSVYNLSAVNNSQYTYDNSNRQAMETSGNFIHPTKQIVDDCYPGGGQYMDYSHETGSPAHYWYIKGEIYIYDQYISAFTGSSNAYLENIDLPLTITAGSHGRLDLLDIHPNLYAYYSAGTTKLAAGEEIRVNNKTYALNDVITYWDYMQLSESDKSHFVKETYVNKCAYQEWDELNRVPTGPVIPEGTAILPTEYTNTWVPAELTDSVYDVKNQVVIPKSELYHVSNAVSHQNGYVLTVDMTNPVVWDKWYSPQSGDQKKRTDETHGTDYLPAPTYYTDATGVYGQRYYYRDEVVTQNAKDAYDDAWSRINDTEKTNLGTQAVVAKAYVAVTKVEYDIDDPDSDDSSKTIHKTMQAGVGISAAEYAQLDASTKAKFEKAYTCTSTFVENKDENSLIYYATLISETKYNHMVDSLTTAYNNASVPDAAAAAQKTMTDHFDDAYMVTSEGNYGGRYFTAGNNYLALDTWASLSATDRQHFFPRYDALDALVLPNYPGTGEIGSMVDYDGGYKDTKPVYGVTQAIDYNAKYLGTTPITFTYKDQEGVEHTQITNGSVVPRDYYELLPNEQHHYNGFTVTSTDMVYIIKETFISGGTVYNAGKTIDKSVYDSFDADRRAKVMTFTPPSASTTGTTYYVCRNGYTVGEHGEGQAVTSLNVVGSAAADTQYSVGNPVPAGTIITKTDYERLVNRQQNFTIQGNAPVETSTLIVSGGSDIYDLSKDRVMTVIYQYKYEEADENGNIEEITERHVINIHIVFKSGVPTVGQLQDPSLVLPGQTVGLKQPDVTEGAYTILGGGWELYTNPEDAVKHQNGQEYTNNATPMYWYQDGYWVAYYTKTYLGKTFSNSVQFKVANYHDIADVMAHPEYMYIDNPNVKRNSKIYIDNSYTETHPDATKSEIDMLYDLFDKSVAKDANKKKIQVDVQKTNAGGEPLYYQLDSNGNPDKTKDPVTDPTPFPVTEKQDKWVQTINDHTRNLANLDFFLNEDVATKKATWTPIGHVDADPTKDECFMGTLHGMGHTISGLNNSLFENLCGYVYNLGVTGSFTKSGIADAVKTAKVPDSQPETYVHGHVNSSWIYTSADPQTVGGTLQDPILPVVGVANTPGSVAGIHVLNCYFPEECGYLVNTRDNPNNYATPKPLRSFNNGEVTYDLNGFYLNKRYSDAVITSVPDGTTTPTTGDNVIYKYWKQDANGDVIRTGTLADPAPAIGYYLGGGSMHAYDGQNLGYVERLFADGDFVYKYGTIPLKANERYSSSDARYLPIWPDDYYFFGQQLTYGYDEAKRPYQPLPAYARKTVSRDGDGPDNRLEKEERNNVVYRIPAYYRSKVKQMAYFNPQAVFADHIADGYRVDDPILDGRKVHPGLTALDFTGFNDRAIMVNAGTSTQKFQSVPNNVAFTQVPRAGLSAPYDALNDGAYFAPITDYTTLTKFETHDITQNLLAYAPTTTWSAGTANTQRVLLDYFNDPVYATYYSADNYRKVAALNPSDISSVKGHLVMKENSADLSRHYYYAAEDHFLVDKQDFNAPFEYEFNPAKGQSTQYRMWYQRKPDNYANKDKGWEGVSLPFAAELVTTQQKGEITHFYQKAGGGYNAGYDSGHEYWLREFTGVDTKTVAANNVTTALMNYPSAVSGNKTVQNTFLWDYYYNADGKDANGDDYRYEGNNEDSESQPSRNFYRYDRAYANYPLSQPGVPYIVGFPGDRYYEFDLSGTFVPQNSGTTTPAKLAAQTITFASNTGITIRVSDDELGQDGPGMVTNNGYTFYGNYLNVEVNSSVDNGGNKKDGYNYYVLNDEGSAFDLTTTDDQTIGAFRPFFATSASGRLQAPATRSIVFGMGGETQFEPDEETMGENMDRGLYISGKKGRIVVESTLEHDRKVRIVNMAGMLVSDFTIAPGQKVETDVRPGVYIVNHKKLMIK